MTTGVLAPAGGHGGSSTSRAPKRRVDLGALGTWGLAGGLVLFLGVKGGGYDIIVRSQIGVVLWWIILVGAAWGLLPTTRVTRVGAAALALFAAFVVWTALASTWSLSSERSLQELSRVASYLAVLLLGLTIQRDRERAVRHTVQGVSAAITGIVILALLSRLLPDTFPAARTTAAFLPGAQARLGWPLNYWNALAALVALGLPLLLSVAASARSLGARAAAAAALPLLVLCEYLTFSRGGAIASVVAVLVFVALAPHRLPKLATILVSGASPAVLIGETIQRGAIERGLAGPPATTQGHQLLLWALGICVVGALAQVGIGRAERRLQPSWLQISPRWARALLATALVVGLVATLLAGGISHLDHAWQQFKHPTSAALAHYSPARYGSVSGNGRYDFWKVALQSTHGRLLTGSGPGTFQLIWQRRAPYPSVIVNAHSLYIETLAEVGLVGLLLLVAFFVVSIGASVRGVVASAGQARTHAAALTAALIAFSISAIADWIWQVPVLPAAFLLLAAAALTPGGRARKPPHRRWLVRAGLALTAIACLAAIAVPLATVSQVRQSEAAAAAGDTTRALIDARSAARLEPDAASPPLQEALVLELRRRLPAAIAAARTAARNEPDNWSTWLVLSRLEAEAGHPEAAIADYRLARRDNPRSQVFAR